MTKLKEIRERLKKATPGPWDCRIVPVPDGLHHQRLMFSLGKFHITKDLAECQSISSVITNAPTDINYLLNLVERQSRAIDLLKLQRNEFITINHMGRESAKIQIKDADILIDQILTETEGADEA